MMLRVNGEFHGMGDNAVFRLSNNSVWVQKSPGTRYRFRMNPAVVVMTDGSRYVLRVPEVGMDIEVVPGQLIASGEIQGEFRGFFGDTVIRLDDGSRWRQADSKCADAFDANPSAWVVSCPSGTVLQVEGMDETFLVEDAG